MDGADQPTALYESNAFNEVAPYLIEDGHTMSASEVIITEDAWNKLSDGQKAAVSEAGKLPANIAGNFPVRLKRRVRNV